MFLNIGLVVGKKLQSVGKYAVAAVVLAGKYVLYEKGLQTLHHDRHAANKLIL